MRNIASYQRPKDTQVSGTGTDRITPTYPYSAIAKYGYVGIILSVGNRKPVKIDTPGDTRYDLRKNARAISCFVCHLNIVLNWPKGIFLSDLIAFSFSYNILKIYLRLKNGRSLVNFYQKVLVKKYLFKST